MIKKDRINRNEHITIDAQLLPLIITRHARSKRLILRYDAKSHCVRITHPRHVSKQQAIAFAQSKHAWIANQIEILQHSPIHDGAALLLWGQEIIIRHIGGRGLAHWHDGALCVTGDKDLLPARVRRFVMQETQQRVMQLAQQAAGRLGLKISTVRLRETTSRWGSCSRSGNISICWRLAFAPLEVLEYVVFHEVAHIKHHNHSADFWALVQILCPDYKQHETWLRQHGQQVWRYRF